MCLSLRKRCPRKAGVQQHGRPQLTRKQRNLPVVHLGRANDVVDVVEHRRDRSLRALRVPGGEACAEKARVRITDRDASELQDVAAGMRLPKGSFAHAADLTDDSSMRALLDAVGKAYGADVGSLMPASIRAVSCSTSA